MNLTLKYPATPEYAAALAELVVPVAREASHASLDYTRRSLRDVDRIIEGFRVDRLKAEQIAETLFSFGCYVGEVFVRERQGVWRATGETNMAPFAAAPMIVQLAEDRFCNPIDKVFKRFENGPEDDLDYFFSIFADGSDAA